MLTAGESVRHELGPARRRLSLSFVIHLRKAENAVAGECIAPFAEVEVTRQDRLGGLVPFRDQVMEVFIVWRAQRFKREVVDDEDRYAGKLLQFALIGTGRARCLQTVR